MSEKDRPGAEEGPGEEDRDETVVGQEHSTFEEQLEEAIRDAEQFREMFKRAQADLVNYRRRAEEEKEELRRFGKSQLLLNGLSVLDDLERALEMVPEDAVVTGWLEGLHLVLRKLQQWMESEGVTRIEARGLPFSPTEHEAVGYENAPDGVEEGFVVSVMRVGYKLHDRVLRASQVTVARPSQDG